MKIRLTRRLARVIDGIDLANHHIGDVIDLSRHDANVLIAEGWAVPHDAGGPQQRSEASDEPRRRPRRSTRR